MNHTRTKGTSRRGFIRKGAGGLVAFSASAAAGEPSSTLSNGTLKVIAGLRTIHGDFTDKSVAESDLKLILDASVRAANASAMQTYSIIVTRDTDKINRLTGYRSTTMLLYCADYTRLFDSAAHLGCEFQADNIMDFITASTNTMLAAQTAAIAAKSLGIDSFFTNGVHRGDMERVWGILDLPQKSCFPLIALLLGYPKREPAYLKGRLKGPGVVHYEKFHRLTKAELDELVRQYDDKSSHLGLREDWEQAGHKHYLEWLYKSWLGGRSKQSKAETQAFQRLKKSGFIDLQG